MVAEISGVSFDFDNIRATVFPNPAAQRRISLVYKVCLLVEIGHDAECNAILDTY